MSTTQSPPESIAAPPVSDPCPRCGKALVDPDGLGWCPGCGFCKSLAQDNSQQLLADEKLLSLGGVVEAGGAITSLPLWFWTSLLVIAVGIGASIGMNKQLPEGENLTRATWASVQIAAGVLFIFLAQCYALMTVAPSEPTMSFKDAVTPFRLWPMVCKRLPNLKGSLWTALFGLSLIVGAAAFIGGLGHWFIYLPKSAGHVERERAKPVNTGGGEPVVIPE